MPRIIPINAVVADGSPPLGIVPPAAFGTPVEAAYGEDVTVHVVARYPSGKPIPSSSQHVLTYGARVRPAPAGQLLFKHVGVATADGGWDCPIVPADYKLVPNGFGRFFFDLWLTDSTVNPPLALQLQKLVAWVVTPAAVLATDPSTAPVPAAVTAYGLPSPTPTNAALITVGGSLTWGLAGALGYSAAPGGWTGGAPATVGAALDRIALALGALGHKP